MVLDPKKDHTECRPYQNFKIIIFSLIFRKSIGRKFVKTQLGARRQHQHRSIIWELRWRALCVIPKHCTLLVLIDFCSVWSELEFCLLKLLIFYQKLLWNIRSRLNSSTFWFFEPVIRYVWSKLKLFAQKMKIFIKYLYLNTGSETQNVEKLSLDLIFAGKIAKVFVTELQVNNSL